ncbi:hypothetical protein N7449_005061 [Penicillium cf. viridicatum]|uniref:Uncharacterized protein n=1 Tax=Penicillium cf. viridicatum TaxID=2972119 RepID=A0A9W9SYR6_9EURO|nr:hypothetical protein N7449_005061 [Penicillium cf. viridicatum]
MPLNTAAAKIRMRLIIFFFTIAWLALASLSSATRLYLDITFQNLKDNVVDGMVIVALVSALFSSFGLILVIYPKWLQENCAARFYYVAFKPS